MTDAVKMTETVRLEQRRLDELVKLAGLVEKLEAPSRVTDALIAIAVEFRPTEFYADPENAPKAAEIVKSHGIVDFLKWVEDESNCWSNWVPRYTASIDAAMTLVPEGTEVLMSFWGRDKEFHFARVGDCAAYRNAAGFNRACAITAAALCAIAVRYEVGLAARAHLLSKENEHD